MFSLKHSGGGGSKGCPSLAESAVVGNKHKAKLETSCHLLLKRYQPNDIPMDSDVRVQRRGQRGGEHQQQSEQSEQQQQQPEHQQDLHPEHPDQRQHQQRQHHLHHASSTHTRPSWW